MPKLPGDRGDLSPAIGNLPVLRGPLERSAFAVGQLGRVTGELAASLYDDDGRRKKQLALDQLSAEMTEYVEAIEADASRVDNLTSDFEAYFGDKVDELAEGIQHRDHQFDFRNRAKAGYEQTRHAIFSTELDRQRGRAKIEFEKSATQIVNHATALGTEAGFLQAHAEMEQLIADHELAKWFDPEAADAIRKDEFNALEVAIGNWMLTHEKFDMLNDALRDESFKGFDYLTPDQRASFLDSAKRMRQSKTAALVQADVIQNPMNYQPADFTAMAEEEIITEQAVPQLLRTLKVERGAHIADSALIALGSDIYHHRVGYGGSPEHQKATNAFYREWSRDPKNQSWPARLDFAYRSGAIPDLLQQDLFGALRAGELDDQIGASRFIGAIANKPALAQQISGREGGRALLEQGEAASLAMENGVEPAQALQEAKRLATTKESFKSESEFNQAFDEALALNGLSAGRSSLWDELIKKSSDFDLDWHGVERYGENVEAWLESVREGDDDALVPPSFQSRFEQRVRDIYMATQHAGSGSGQMPLDRIIRQAFSELIMTEGPTRLLNDSGNLTWTAHPPEAYHPPGADGTYRWWRSNAESQIDRHLAFYGSVGQGIEKFATQEPDFSEQYEAFKRAHGVEEAWWGPLYRRFTGNSEDNLWETVEETARIALVSGIALDYAIWDLGDPDVRATWEGAANLLPTLTEAAGLREPYQTPLTYRWRLTPDLSMPRVGLEHNPARMRYNFILETARGKQHILTNPDGDPVVYEADIGDSKHETRLRTEMARRDVRPIHVENLLTRGGILMTQDELHDTFPETLDAIAGDPALTSMYLDVRSRLTSREYQSDPDLALQVQQLWEVGQQTVRGAAKTKASGFREKLSYMDADRRIRQRNDDPDRTLPLYESENLDTYDVVNDAVDISANLPESAVYGLKPQMVEAIRTVRDAYVELGLLTPLLTSGQRDTSPETGKPEKKLHRLGYAADFRLKHASTKQIELLASRLKQRLPKGFQVFTSIHGTERHLHIEYDTPESKAQLQVATRED